MKLLITLLTLFSLVPGWAGGVNSGGGYVVACNENDQTTYEFLDLFEGKEQISGFKLKELPAGADEFEMANAVLDRLVKFSPQLTKEWKQTVSDFKSREMKFVKNAVIKDIQDDEMILRPLAHCRTIQAAVQVKQPAKNEFRLYIDEKIWEKLDSMTRSALLVHEAIYKTAMQQGHVNSVKFRRITSLLFSEEIDKNSDAEIAELFKLAEINGCFLKSFSYTNFNESEPYTKFKLNLEIKSFYQDPNNQTSAVICEQGSIDNFFGINRIIVQRGNIVNASTSRICIEKSLEQKSTVQFFKREYGKPSIKMEDKVCLGDSGKDKVLFAKVSPLKPEFLQPEAMTFDKCIGQGFYEGQIETCEAVRADIKTADGQILTLENYRLSDYMYKDWHGFLINEANRKINFGGVTLKLGRVLHINELGQINLPVIDKEQMVNINGTECLIEDGHTIVLNSKGEFVTVLAHMFLDKPSKSNSCVALLNKN